MKRKIYHVVADENQWQVKLEGAERASANLNLKAEAVKTAAELAKNTGLGQVKIHGLDGKIQEEHTYGKDPRKYKG